MRKILSFIMIFMLAFVFVSPVFAVDGYSFDLQYTGTIVKNQAKDAKVLLVGVNAPAYTNVVIKVDITGPATPTILATDNTGTEHDIAQLRILGTNIRFSCSRRFHKYNTNKGNISRRGKLHNYSNITRCNK